MLDRWPHQIRGVEAVLAAIRADKRRLCLTSPTGGGKTLMVADICETILGEGNRVVIYSNRRMMVDQLSAAMDAVGLRHGVRSPDHDDEGHLPLQVSSIATEIARTKKRAGWKLHDARLAVVDEAHLQTGLEARKILDAHLAANATVLGITATPLDLEGLYEDLIVAGTASELRKCGALVLAHHFSCDEPDFRQFKKLREGAETISENDSRKAMMRPGIFARVLDWFEKLNPQHKPTILFAPGVRESIYFAEQFTLAGITAAHIDGQDVWAHGKFYKSNADVRASVLAASKDGRCPVICNRFVLREGIDAPWLSHCILATCIGSLSSYIQTIGRVLRAAPGKTTVTIQDHGGCLDERTEILTDRGWLGRTEILESDQIGTMDMASGAFRWSACLGIIDKDRDGSMVGIGGNCPHLDIRVTDYHEMVMRADLRRGAWKKLGAGDLTKRQSNWIIPVAAIEDVPDCELTDAELGFIGWFFTDGGMDGARVRIYQSENSPLAHHDHIVKSIEGCGFRYTHKRRVRPNPFADGQTVEIVCSISSGRKSELGWDRLTKWLDKSFPLEVFNALSRRQFGVLLHAMNLGDGCKHTTYQQKTKTLAVASREAADRIQSLAVRRGYRCNLAEQREEGRNVIHLLHARDAQMATVGKQEFRQVSDAVSERVWCVQTETGTILIRRNGKVCIVGNSWWRHGSPNVDRQWFIGATANMVNGMRADDLRANKQPKPSRCPKCGMVQIWKGPKCQGCDYVRKPQEKVSRPVVQMDGTLKEMVGDIFRPHRTCTRHDGPEIWKRMYFRSLTKKANGRTFRAAAALFAQENNWAWPNRQWPLMPIRDVDLFSAVRDVPHDMLIQN